jgi:signal transduction histidine kinase
LRLRVWDNGKGFDPETSVNGKNGHFGLAGMQERAVRFQGRLAIAGSQGAGTEVKLVVPRSIVFPSPSGGWFRQLLRKPYGRK